MLQGSLFYTRTVKQVRVCCHSSSLWKSHPRSVQEMLVFSIAEQSYCSAKPRKLFVVLFFSDGNGEKSWEAAY